jgi:hypothetical protein
VATVTEVQTQILGDLHRSDLTAQAATAMSNAVNKLRMERFWFNEMQASFSITTTSAFELATYLPTLLQLDTARIWHNGAAIALDRMHWSDLADLDEVDDTGVPSSWAVHHQVLRLYPTPNENMVLEVSGLKELSLTAWCELAPTLVRTVSEIELYTLVTHDVQGAQRAAEYTKMEMDALRKRLPDFATGGEVRGYL